MTEATRITIDNIERMIEKISETEYRRGYADALKEKELTEKHWKQAEVTDLLHGLWKERIKERRMNYPRREDATNAELITTIIQIQGYLGRLGANVHNNYHETLNEVIERLEKMEDKTE